RFNIVYDLARVALAQARYADALALFRECQRTDAKRCSADRFALSGGSRRPSIDEYAAACERIVGDKEQLASSERLSGGGEMAGHFDALLDIYAAPRSHAGRDDRSAQALRRVPGCTMAEAALEGPRLAPAGGYVSAGALERAAHAYLGGLRLLERDRPAGALAWFVHGQRILAEPGAAPAPAPGGPAMVQSAEKDRALRAALQAQLAVHGDVARALERLAGGASPDAVAPLVDAVLGAHVAVRFEFLERIVLACLRQDSRALFMRLVAALGTGHKLYQQLPDVHLALLQVASLLVVVRDALAELRLDARALLVGLHLDAAALDGGAVARLRAAVAEIAALLAKVPAPAPAAAAPQLGAEGELARFCRLWGDAPQLALLGAMLAEHAADAQLPVAPWALSRLARAVVQPQPPQPQPQQLPGTGVDQARRTARHLQDAAHTALARAHHHCGAVPSAEFLLASVSPRPLPAAALLVSALSQLTALDPVRLCARIAEPWVQRRLPRLAQNLRDLRMAGAAAVVLQMVALEACLPVVVLAFERAEIDSTVAGFFWDPCVIEYAEHLARSSSPRSEVRFAVPSEKLVEARPLLIAEFFSWLAAALSERTEPAAA
ncbi:hypothetical protein GGF37_005265, partial [Kickxella alabastrina]